MVERQMVLYIASIGGRPGLLRCNPRSRLCRPISCGQPSPSIPLPRPWAAGRTRHKAGHQCSLPRSTSPLLAAGKQGHPLTWRRGHRPPPTPSTRGICRIPPHVRVVKASRGLACESWIIGVITLAPCRTSSSIGISCKSSAAAHPRRRPPRRSCMGCVL